MIYYSNYSYLGYLLTIAGWWLTYPSEKYKFVSWDDDIPNWMEKTSCSKPPTT